MGQARSGFCSSLRLSFGMLSWKTELHEAIPRVRCRMRFRKCQMEIFIEMSFTRGPLEKAKKKKKEKGKEKLAVKDQTVKSNRKLAGSIFFAGLEVCGSLMGRWEY
ncbi:hypothetical protein ABW19_dt0206599 [Dactylella cylindrospora]|nr:hypothetical protein ABW19_dt0206599 [Dactylella cylindrospora]